MSSSKEEVVKPDKVAAALLRVRDVEPQLIERSTIDSKTVEVAKFALIQKDDLIVVRPLVSPG